MSESIAPEIAENPDAGEQSIAEDVQKIVGAVGNNPAVMVAMIALDTLPPGTYINTKRLNRHINILQGHLPSEGDDALHTHSIGRTLLRVGLAQKEVDESKDRVRDIRRVRLAMPMGETGLSVAGVLLPIELAAPQDNFLRTVLGKSVYIGNPNPRLGVYKRLLDEGAVATKDLYDVTGFSRQGQKYLLDKLVDTGVCVRNPHRGGRGEAMTAVALHASYQEGISALLGKITSLAEDSPKGQKCREESARMARAMPDFPEYIDAVLRGKSWQNRNT